MTVHLALKGKQSREPVSFGEFVESAHRYAVELLQFWPHLFDRALYFASPSGFKDARVGDSEAFLAMAMERASTGLPGAADGRDYLDSDGNKQSELKPEYFDFQGVNSMKLYTSSTNGGPSISLVRSSGNLSLIHI